MTISCSSYGIIKIEHPRQGISDMVRSGFESISLDLNMGCLDWELENLGRKLKTAQRIRKNSFVEEPAGISECFETMIRQCKEKGLNISIARAPFLPRDTKRTDLNEHLLKIMEEGIRLCGKIGCGFLVVPPLFAGLDKTDVWQVNHDYYMYLGKIASENHVMLLLENQCKSVNGHLVRGICSDGRTAAEWVDCLNAEIGEEQFGFCMDVGVCNLCGQNMYDFASELGSRIKAVILRDCNGSDENSMLPFTCVNKRSSQTDWLNLIRGLREVGFDGFLVVDYSDTAAAFSPILRPALLRLAKEVADYFKWQIGLENLLKKYPSVVLFGAGNMCRNYMKCYGEKYSPLFTCDNNKTLWGTSFCGLEVKPPESLLDIPKDCAVFICNIYYREIEQQLRDMGIKNPIEYFNDEYMPTFYFDRLEDGGNR